MNTFKQHSYPADPRFREEDGWNVFISYIGFFKSSGDFHWEQTSPMYAVHAIQKGCGVFERGGRKYLVKAGESFTFFPGDPVVYYDFPESPWEYIWFRLSGRDTEKILRVSSIRRERPHVRIAEPTKLETYLHDAGSMYDKRKHPPLFPMTAAFNCLDMISGGVSGHKIAGTRGGGRKSMSESFVSIVESRLDRTPSVNEIAKLMKIDRTTLFRAFVREQGISPKRFLENRRLEKAKGLLSSTQLSVKEISDACGFSHPGQFCRIFRMNCGETPAKWRNG